jgi:ABC-2 type transport system permease protein
MLTKIARFEFRYVLRNPLLWVTAAATFGMMVIGMSVDGFELGSEGGLLENATFAIAKDYLIISTLFMFVTTSFVANVTLRDDETGFGPIIRSTPITKFEYVCGRFLGAYAVAAFCLLAVPLGIFVGSNVPWADSAQFGPYSLASHLFGLFVFALPNILIHAAIFFALATITRSMMATYIGVISFMVGFFILQESFMDKPYLRMAVTLADPFGARAFSDATRYWTIAERNGLLPSISGLLLYNRLLWVGIALACLVLAYTLYDKKWKKSSAAGPAEEERPATTAATIASPPLPQRGATRALLWMRTKFEARQVIVSPAFPVLMLWGMFTTIFVLITQRDPSGRPRFPTTLILIPKIEDAFSMVPLMIAIYYAGELVWRERDRRMHEIIDASPLPSWTYVVSKTIAIAVVLIAAVFTNVVASITAQLALGYTNIELGKYVLWYVLPTTWDMLLIAVLAVFIQALSPHKTVGWGVMILFVAAKFKHLFHHNLMEYGGIPSMPLSDMNGASSFWKGAWTFRLYWAAFACLLLLVAHLLWRRGTEIRLAPRVAHAWRRLGGTAGRIAAAVLAVFIGTGAYAFYNTNVLNEYRTKSDDEAFASEFEKKHVKYVGLPQPVPANVTLDIALDPQQRRAVTHGSYVLRNETSQPISEVHVRTPYGDLQLMKESLENARLIVDDRKFGYRIYRFETPMRPGEERVLTFETERWQRGFRNDDPNTSLIENGTFMDNIELSPVVGTMRLGMLEDDSVRRKYGLPPAPGLPKLEDVAATMQESFINAWATSDITISTTADQTPLAPGKKILDVTRDGRRIARFVSTAPIHPLFSIQSARYSEKHRQHGDVDLAVYYHPAHPWNIDRMLDALEVSLDYYQANYGPYQFDHVRIVEFPGYRYFAQAFAGTIPYSETYGFIADVRKPDTLDIVSGTTAHELAHQYWAHQVIGANMEGQTVLSETLANYSALMVLRKTQGEDHIRRYLQTALDRYLSGRGYLEGNEPPLARAGGENSISYQKGSLAMYLLQTRMGEAAINRALRGFLEQYRFKGPPYPRTLELIAALRAEAQTAEEQNLITDLFERVTLYDLRVDEPVAVHRADGKWDVKVPVDAKKLYAGGKDEVETPLAENIEVGLFSAEPGTATFNASNVIVMQRQPIRSGHQVLTFVTERKPAFAGVDPYNYYIDRSSSDNVAAVK